MQLGKYGVWTSLMDLPPDEIVRCAQKIEALGYSALWIPEATIREPVALSALILANTKKLIMATGIANIYARDASAMKGAQMTLNELFGGRFLLGLGVSHKPMVEGRGHAYDKPLTFMRTYLEAMDKSQYFGPPPKEAPLRVIGALGPKMIELSRTHADGAHPYLMPPEHTAQARKILGPDKLLIPEQKVVFESDPAKARKAGYEAMKFNLMLPNYRKEIVKFGFTEADIDGPSDKLVDALVAWGDEKNIRARIKAHLDAGATQVCIQPVRADGGPGPDLRILELLAK